MYSQPMDSTHSTVNMKPSKETDDIKKRKYEFVEMKLNQTDNVEVKRMKLVDGRRMPVFYFKVDKEKKVQSPHGSPTIGLRSKSPCSSSVQCTTPCYTTNLQTPQQTIEWNASLLQPESSIQTPTAESINPSEALLILSMVEQIQQENIQLMRRIQELEQNNQTLIALLVQMLQGAALPQE